MGEFKIQRRSFGYKYNEIEWLVASRESDIVFIIFKFKAWIAGMDKILETFVS